MSLRKYSEYLKDNPEGYWFKRKLYGWGWTPVTKEGWGVTTGFVILLVVFSFVFNPEIHPTRYLIAVLCLVIIFIRIAYLKGEKPKWQWGLPKDKKEERSVE